MIYIFRYSDKPYFKTVSVFTTIAWLGLKVPDFMIYLGPVLINNGNQIDHTLRNKWPPSLYKYRFYNHLHS